MKADLIQPRHTYAEPIETGKLGQIHTNSSLRTIGAQLDTAGVEVNIHDLNINPDLNLTSDLIGINLLGAPYIPEAIKLIAKIRKQYGEETKIVLGGQVLTQKTNRKGQPLGLSSQQFEHLFGENVYNGMIPGVVQDLCGILTLPNPEEVSLIHVYEKLSNEEFKLYFSKEISLYISQGCSQNCSFCAADKGRTEKYRNLTHIMSDMEYIAERCLDLGITHCDAYLSNLDILQSATALSNFANMLEALQDTYPDFTWTFRGLGQTSSFMKLHNKNPELLQKLRNVGLTRIGYGVDGISEAVRKGIKKPQNNEKNTMETIRLSVERYKIIPELLMVFGHYGIDTPETMKDAYNYVKKMVEQYGAIPRPHISKSCIPGNDGRNGPGYADFVAKLIDMPELFQVLDFTALASKETHPDDEFREKTNHRYQKMCELPGNTTQIIQPYELEDTPEIREWKKQQNIGKFDI